MLAQTYLSMSRDEQIQVVDLVDHHEKDANGEPIPHDDKEGNEINEVESAYADKIAAYKRAGGTIKRHSPDKKRIKQATDAFKAKLAKTQKIQSAQDEKEKAEKEQQDEAHMGMGMPMDKGSVKKRVDMFKKLRDKKASQGYQKTDLANEELTSGQKKLPPALQQAIAKKNMQKKTEKSEEVSKNVSKLNKIQENRRLERNKVVADGQGGAGVDGTDKLAKKYQQVTPGQPNNLIKESSVVVNSQDMFKRFEDMVSYMMGISVTHPESFQMFPIGESGKMRLEYEHGPLATICEDDVIQFFGPNTDMEQFVEMVKEFGVNVTTAENSFVVGDSAGTEGTVKEITPGQYAEEYAKKYTTGGMMDQMRANIEELAKRI